MTYTSKRFVGLYTHKDTPTLYEKIGQANGKSQAMSTASDGTWVDTIYFPDGSWLALFCGEKSGVVVYTAVAVLPNEQLCSMP